MSAHSVEKKNVLSPRLFLYDERWLHIGPRIFVKEIITTNVMIKFLFANLQANFLCSWVARMCSRKISEMKKTNRQNMSEWKWINLQAWTL